MANKKCVVALGRNSFSSSFPKQQERVKTAAKAIADLVEEGRDIVITHSNGPQVGMIWSALSEYSRNHKERTNAPMSICGAMSQGYIGYDLQNAIRTELLNRGIYKPVSTIITQVRVDPFDKAFNNPTKVIGKVLTEDEANLEEKKGNHVVEISDEEAREAGIPEGEKGYRRIIASPHPIDIYEIDAIKTLFDNGQLVIAAGGGGIPVLQQYSNLKGASAIIEKDYTAAALANMLDADELLILSSCDYLTVKGEDGSEVELKEISKEEAEQMVADDKFDAITSLPKIEAALDFVGVKDGRSACISNLEKVKETLDKKVGTWIN